LFTFSFACPCNKLQKGQRFVIVCIFHKEREELIRPSMSLARVPSWYRARAIFRDQACTASYPARYITFVFCSDI